MFCLLIKNTTWYNSTKHTTTVLPHCSPSSRQVLGTFLWLPCGSVCVESNTILEINSARSGQYDFPNVMKFLQKGG